MSRWVGHGQAWYVLPVCGLMVLLWFLRQSRMFLIAYCLLVVLIGSWVATIDASTFSHGVPEEFHDTWVRCKGRVASMPKQKEQGKRVVTSFVLACEEMRVNKRVYPVRERIQVSLINPSAESLWGDYIKVYGRGAIPKEARNAGQFDYREYLSRKNIHYVVRAFGEKSTRVYTRHGWLAIVTRTITKVREHIRTRIREDFDGVARSFAYAFLLGERGSIPYDIKDAFIRTGTIHVLAISGMHVSLIAGVVYCFFRVICIGPLMRVVCGMCVLLAYALVCGANIPVLRAVLMIAMVYGAYAIQRRRNFLAAIGIACSVLLLLCPEYVYMPGFQLSFVSVLSIVYLSPIFVSLRKRVREGGVRRCSKIRSACNRVVWYVERGCSVSLSALCGVAPILLYHFHLVSCLGIIVNVLIMPCIVIMLLGMVLYGASCFLPWNLSLFPVLIFTLCTDSVCAIVSWCASIPVGRVAGATLLAWKICLYYSVVIICVVVAKRMTSLRRASACVLLLVAAVYVYMSAVGFVPAAQASITVFDCGKTEVVCVQTKTHTMLFNTGRGYPSFHARWIIKGFLFLRGVQRLSSLFMSSDRGKHWGGVRDIVYTFYPRMIVGPKGREARISLACIKRGTVYENGQADFSLYPDDEVFVRRYAVSGAHDDASHSVYVGDDVLLLYNTAGAVRAVLEDGGHIRAIHVGEEMQASLHTELEGSLLAGSLFIVCSGETDPHLREWVITKGGTIVDTKSAGMIEFLMGTQGISCKSFMNH